MLPVMQYTLILLIVIYPALNCLLEIVDIGVYLIVELGPQ